MSAGREPLRADRDEMLQAMEALTMPGQVTELRMPKVGSFRTVSGYFDSNHHKALVDSAAFYDLQGAPGIYVTMNPVTPDLLARAYNHVKAHAEESASDQNILKRIRLLLDLDPVRPAGISSTDAEHDAALGLMLQIAYHLENDGWSAPIRADSGNGGHLLYAVDLPNDEESKQLIQAVLRALANRFDNGTVKVDQAVFNSARIIKLPGSVTRKGDSTEDRPHRLSRLVEVPPVLKAVPLELLRETARQAEPRRWVSYADAHAGLGANNHPAPFRFDLGAWIARHALTVRGPMPYDGGQKWQLDCPFNRDHRAPDAFVLQRHDGTLVFHCSHTSCRDYHWRDFRERIEGSRLVAPQPAVDFVPDGSGGLHINTGDKVPTPKLSDLDPQPGPSEDDSNQAPQSPSAQSAGGTREKSDGQQSDSGGTNNNSTESKLPDAVQALLTELEATADSSLLYQNIETIAKLTDTQLAIVALKLKGILGRKLNQTDFRNAIREARARQRKIDAEAAEQRHITGSPYRISHGGIVRVVEKESGPEVIPLTNFIATVNEDINEDDGVETKRFFRIGGSLQDKSFTFSIPAGELSPMAWPIQHIGPTAIVHPNQKDWARAAIQSLSTSVVEHRVYTHTGWRKVGDVSVYLHGPGAIGPAGAVAGVDVRLSGAVRHYGLELPRSNQESIEAILASLRIIGLAKGAAEHIPYVLLSAVYRACVRPCDFSIWIAGPTGVFKTEVAALAQQHYGRAMDARHLPGNFSSTGNSLEVVAFTTKDALAVFDDFAPHGSIQDVAKYHATADRILRAAGNSQGRGRLSADARPRDAKPPRGLIIVTGEDLPRGQSIRGRTFMMEIAQGDIDAAALTKCQEDAASGAYAKAMGGFVQSIAARYDEVQTEYSRLFPGLRAQATRAHSRTPGIVADLFIGFTSFLEFAVAAGAITSQQHDDLAARCWHALQKTAGAQRVQQEASEPAHRFLELLRAAISSLQGHIASLDGTAPPNPVQWGWHTIGTAEHERSVGAGKCIGWLEGPNLYLEPIASYGLAQEIGRQTGEPLVVGEKTLRRRLHERGLLESVDAARETLTIRKRIQGREMPVLNILASAITGPPARFSVADDETETFRC
jgi:hypothetical protein